MTVNPFDGSVTLRRLPFAARVLFSCFLLTMGIGYLFALTYLFLIDLAPQQGTGIHLVQSTIIKYYGNRGDTRLETALNGSMSTMLMPEEKARVIDWIRGGAGEEEFRTLVPILEQRCIACHNEESALVSLATFEAVKGVTEMDLGESIRTLARVSHVHLLGMSFIFMLTGSVFLLTEVRPAIRAIVVALPFVAIWIDIGSWWFTKYQPVFAYTVIIGGILMGICLAAQILMPLWEMWFKKGIR
jgi:hypothetical protein